jgi:hypothetical protein
MRNLRVFILIGCLALTIIISYSCTSAHYSSTQVSIGKHYLKLLDSLNNQPNDYILYYQSCYCYSFSPEVIYSIINYDSLLKIIKIDNIHKNNSLPVLQRNTSIFEELVDLIQVEYNSKYPILSKGSYYTLSLRIKNKSYFFEHIHGIYDNHALNCIKSFLLDLEIDNEFVFK